MRTGPATAEELPALRAVYDRLRMQCFELAPFEQLITWPSMVPVLRMAMRSDFDPSKQSIAHTLARAQEHVWRARPLPAKVAKKRRPLKERTPVDRKRLAAGEKESDLFAEESA